MRKLSLKVKEGRKDEGGKEGGKEGNQYIKYSYKGTGKMARLLRALAASSRGPRFDLNLPGQDLARQLCCRSLIKNN